MNIIFSEFEIRDDMYNDEFEFMKQQSIINVIQRYIEEVKNSGSNEPSIFNKKIAFDIREVRYGINNRLFEKIVLNPININTIEYNPKFEAFSTPKKYSFKDRIKILFTGRK